MIISHGPTPSWSTITSMCLRTVCDKNASEYEQASARKQLFIVANLADKAAKALADAAAAGRGEWSEFDKRTAAGSADMVRMSKRA